MIIKSLAKKAGYLIATLIVLAAVTVCIVRLLTPVLDQHRKDFENVASEYLQTPVTITNVRVSWYHYQPVISLNDVTILHQETKKPVFKVKKISLFLSIFDSLWQRKIVTNGIMASGAVVNVNQAANGELTVAEFSSLPFAQGQGETRFIDVMAGISAQPYLILSDIDVYYKGVGKKDRYITLYNLAFRNTDTRHSIVGKAILHQEIPTEVSVNASWHGKVSDFPNIKAKTYLYVSGLSLSQWAKNFSYHGFQIKHGIVAAKIWADWMNGSFQKIQSAFQTYDLALYSETSKMTHAINRLSGNLGWKQDENRQIFAGDDILLDLPNHLWPVTSFSVSITRDAKNNIIPEAINIAYLDLADIQPFLLSAGLLTDANQKLLSTLKLTGSLQNLGMTFANSYNDYKHVTLKTDFSRLSFSPWKKIPGLTNVSGNLKWSGNQGEIKLSSNNMVVQYLSLFPNDIALDQLSGDLTIQETEKNWLLNITSLHMLNTDLAANVQGSITLTPDKSPVTDLKANMTMKRAVNVTRYLPAGIFDKELNAWLKNAFLSGEVVSSHAVLRGSLTDFPFEKGNGEFSIQSRVNNIDFRFAPDWPLLRRVSGELIFKGNSMTIDVDSAQTLGIPVSKVHGVIPYPGSKKPQILEITTDTIESNFIEGMKYIHSSPLKKKIGKMFEGIDLRGEMGLKLGLIIPLKNPDNTRVKGDLDITHASMDLSRWNLKLTELDGRVAFTEDSTQGKNIQAALFGKPLQFDLATVNKGKNNSVVQATLNNNFDINDFANWLKLPITKTVTGTTKINGVIDLSLTQPLEVHLRSSLEGVTIDLPDQFGKKAQEARDFSADIILQNGKPIKLKSSYGNLLSTALILERQNDNYRLLGINLHLGAGAADWPVSDGIYVTGTFDTLDWDKIKSLTSQQSGPASNKTFSVGKLKGVDVKLNRVLLGGQTLTDVNLQVKPQDENWDIHIESPEISGQLTVPVNLKRQSQITAQFEKIDLHAGSNESTLTLDIKSLPALNLVANNVRYNDMPIGKITFNAVPSSAGLNIKNLSIVSSYIDLRAAGEWKQNGKEQMTILRGGATSTKVSKLLKSFGLDVRNFVSSNGSLNFNLSWPNAPYAPSVAALDGNASLVLGPGRIVDIGEGNGAKMDIGRMLSIFSLQTIPRRLSLDFSDIFQKGYSFDSLRGDFDIQDGNINTQNMRFDGPVAQVGINGRIGLKDKDYNFILNVTAHVTSSIPVAATLITGNPLIGLGALAVNTVLGSKVSGVTTNYYKVTGGWDNPEWKSIKSGG